MIYELNDDKVTFSKTDKTIVFVDYEAWYWGLLKHFSMTPNIREWFDTLQDKGQIDEVVFFGDFNNEKMQPEILKIRSITSSIVDCSKSANEKDYTDFIMLDQIYQRLIRQSDVSQFILFTGDGHFQSVVAFLRNFNNKTVGMYALRGTLSSQLKESANWFVEIDAVSNGSDFIRDLIIGNFRRLENNEGGVATFSSTVKAISAHHADVHEDTVKSVLSDMIRNGYIHQEEVIHPKGDTKVKRLVADWDAIDAPA